MFSCVWLNFKKYFERYFLVFGCVLENTIENTFSTCCSHFLIFSRLPNEYIISFIPQYRNTNKTQKKIIKSKHFARSRSAGRRDRDWRGALHDRDRDCTNRWSRLREGGRFRQTISAIEALDDLGELFFLSLSLALSLSFARDPEMVWR